ncbi:hypothetical protein JOF41_000524 [Saccharothrix coeruleofusca]|uniref:hypothetical protein n=1 Tax=Saccharothrix coeruleofusca TaxID=33919 RepID=UPI001AE33861|nr:hypothetical protein [Saccharothrix coeruleofusca]MBP2334346.1 hypothetical protein [Saccharothrix coeruleofusca]
MDRPELRVELPSGLPDSRYADIARAVSSLLELWDVPEACPELVDLVDLVEGGSQGDSLRAWINRVSAPGF